MRVRVPPSVSIHAFVAQRTEQRVSAPRAEVRFLSEASKPQQNEHGPPERAGHARWGVLGRPDSAAIRAPCVLPSHAPIAPRQRVVIQLGLLTPWPNGEARACKAR